MVDILGLVGPKLKAKAIGDGMLANIPAPSWVFDGVTYF